MANHCTHNPPCSTLRLYHWGTEFIAAQSREDAEEYLADESLLEEDEGFNPREVPPGETHHIMVDEDGCQCDEDDAVDEVEMTPEQWICIKRKENNETAFIVGHEV